MDDQNKNREQLLVELLDLRRQNKKYTREEEARREIFENSPTAMLVVDPESSEIVGANSAAFSYYGYSKQELIGKLMTEIIMLPAERVFELLKEIDNGQSWVQFKNRLKVGQIREVEMSREPLKKDGKTFLFTTIHDVTHHKATEEALRDGEKKLEAITTLGSDAIILLDDQGNVCYWNTAAEQMFGWGSSEIMGKDVENIIPVLYGAVLWEEFKKFSSTGGGPVERRVYEVSALRKDGSEFPVELATSGLLLKDKWYLVGVIKDITQRKSLEMQLRQAQKMEAIGAFAGGIAHDFNNMLTVIIGHATILSMKIAKDDPLLLNVQQILASADRAANLTQSLLTYSRKKHLEIRPVNLNETVVLVEKMLSRLLREDIEIKTTLTDESVTVMADPIQIEQVFFNFATNAQDAMPEGGVFRISTEVVELDQDFIHSNSLKIPGRCVSLTFSDTGVGMDKRTALRIFEPFFTTKEVGKGTGLGLSIVYEIIQQHNGFITCSSEPGKGTTFQILLPLIPIVSAEDSSRAETSPIGGTETILLAEDDTATRNLIRQVLESYGYTVVEAVDGKDAIVKFLDYQDHIDLALLDVVMPNKNGKDVCHSIQELRPEVKCLFSSGYAANIFDDIERKKIHFIPKPIVPTLLLRAIRKILDND